MERYQFLKIKNEIDFEDFSRDFIKILYSDPSFQLYGRKGQSQSGIDGYSTEKNIYFQSKHKSRDNIKDKDIIRELNTEFLAAKPKIEILSDNEKSKYLYITTHKQSTIIQDEAKNISTKGITVEYWGWEAIESSLNDLYKKENIDFFYKYYPDIARNLEENVIQKQLSIKSATETEGFIGREAEIEKIDKGLKEKKTLLINGIGGIGKSSIVHQYLFLKKQEYSYFGIFEDISGFISDLAHSLNLKSDASNDLLKEAIVKLRKLSGNKLFIIDNISDIEKEEQTLKTILSLQEYGFNIIITSRETIDYIPSFELDIMNINDAKNLFNSIYKVEDTLLEEILEYLDNHTFFIEKTAKTLKSKDTLTPEIIKEYFENGKFSKIKMSRKESFEKFLNELFTIDNLEDEEILILKQISILPTVFISFIDLKIILQKKDESEFEDLLNYLTEKGWLSKSYCESINAYKLHQINKEYIFSLQKPDINEIKGVINFFILILINSVDVTVALSNNLRTIYFESLFNSLKTLDIKTIEVFILCEKLANFYLHLGKLPYCFQVANYAISIKDDIEETDDEVLMLLLNILSQVYLRIGDFENSFKYIDKVRIFMESNHDNEIDKDISTVYSNLAICYKSMGSYNNSLIYFEKALKILNSEEENVKSSYVYKGLAELYQLKNNNKQALKFFRKALENRKKFLTNNNPLIAQSYNDLGFIHAKMNKRPTAIILYLEAIKRQKQILGKDHIDLASSYNNIGESYRIQKQYDKAYPFIKEGLRIREKELGENALDTAMSYNTLGTYYIDKEDFDNAIDYLNKSYNILNSTVGPSHDYSLGTKENIEYAYSQKHKVLNKNTSKSGRNDPCPCGSGKKYKKCCA